MLMKPIFALARWILSKEPPPKVNPFQRITQASDVWSSLLDRRIDPRCNISSIGQAYNAEMQRRYIERLDKDIEARGIELGSTSKDHHEFLVSWGAFRDQTLQAIPKQYRPEVSGLFSRKRDQFWRDRGGSEPA